jgi:fluoride exporter
MLWLAIASGGALGSLARHLVNAAVHSRFLASAFPVGTFIVNAAGCLTIGLLAGMIATSRLDIGEHARAFLLVGVLGGFTTFSTFGLDTYVLARGGQPALAAFNAVGQMVLGLVAVWVGFAAGSWRP